MVVDFVLGIFREMIQLNSLLLFMIFFVFVIIAYKVFQTLIKALVIGVISASFPFLANMAGYPMPLTFQSIIWFAIYGVLAYLLYATLMSGVKVIKLVTSPFKVLFRKKPAQVQQEED